MRVFAEKPMLKISIPELAHMKERMRSSAGLITGELCRRERQTNSSAVSTEATSAPIVAGLAQPHSGLCTSPSANRPTANASRSAPNRSGVLASGSRSVSRTWRMANHSSTAPIGRLMRNTHCQAICARNPPTVGPIAAAAAPVADHMRTPPTRLCTGSAASRMLSPVGVIADAPAACSARATTSAHTSQASAHAALESTNSASPPTNIIRRP